MAHYTEKVRSRRLLAEALAKAPERVKTAKLKPSDLDAIARHGKAAEDADNEQKAQLATSSVATSERAGEVAALYAQEAEVRDAVTAAVDELESAGNLRDARFLARISYARFRIRELKPDPRDGAASDGTPADAEVVKKLERLEREDTVARLDGFAGFLAAIRAPEREAIIAELAERDLPADALDKMQADAKALAERGKNWVLASEATKRESDAVLAQSRKWNAVRRLVRRAVAGDAELQRLLGAC